MLYVLGAVLAVAAAPTLEVKVSPKGVATVHVEAEWGVVVGETGTPIEVKQGTAVIRVTRPGFWDAWATVKVPKTGKRRIALRQTPGVPLDDYELTGQVGFSKNGSWQMRDKTPWKVSGKEVIMSGKLPGDRSSGSISFPTVDNYVLSCEIYVSGPVSVRLFGQTLGVLKNWTTVRIIGFGETEYISVNGGRLKKASTVNNGFQARYSKGATGEVRIGRVNFKEISTKSVKYLRRIYRL